MVGGRCGVVEQGDVGGCDQIIWRRRKVARIAQVEGRVIGELPKQVGAGRYLVLRVKGLVLVVAHTEIERKRRQQLPLIR